MSGIKIGALVLYAILGAVALLMPDAPAGVWSLRIILVLVVLHALEVLVFFRACQRAGGSLPGHLLNVFLFGVLHLREIRAPSGGA